MITQSTIHIPEEIHPVINEIGIPILSIYEETATLPVKLIRGKKLKCFGEINPEVLTAISRRALTASEFESTIHADDTNLFIELKIGGSKLFNIYHWCCTVFAHLDTNGSITQISADFHE